MDGGCRVHDAEHGWFLLAVEGIGQLDERTHSASVDELQFGQVDRDCPRARAWSDGEILADLIGDGAVQFTGEREDRGGGVESDVEDGLVWRDWFGGAGVNRHGGTAVHELGGSLIGGRDGVGRAAEDG